MDQHSLKQSSYSQLRKSDIINIRKLTLLILGKWYWLLIALVLAGVFAVLYNKYTLPSYLVSSTILISEDENANLTGLDNNLLGGFGLSPGSQNLDNQILILSSWSLIRETLEELPFNKDVYRKGLLKSVSYFPLSPIELVAGPDGFPDNIEFCFQHAEKNLYHLSVSKKSDFELDTVVYLGQMVKLPTGSFTIFPHPEMEELYKSGEKIYFSFYDMDQLVYSYRRGLLVESATKEGTILKLSMEGPNKTKNMVFLDKLVEVFMMNNLEKKNHEANRIIEFIDEQLVDVEDSLMMTENQLQEFRSKNRIMDVSAQAQQIIDQAVVFEETRARLTLESNYYEYLGEYLSKENNQEVPISPATMGIEDPLLGRLMQELAGLQAEYFSSGVGERNPLQGQLGIRIRNTKQSLMETLQGIKLANSMALDENQQQIRDLNAQASRLPVKERQLLGFERKFNLNNVLYTYLLQERAEAQIQKASNKPDNELIDSARADLQPIAPNKAMVYLLALVLGAGIPFLVILITDTVHNKISSEEDLKMISDLPIVGHVPHSRLSYNTVVLTEPQSRISEAFRSLRSRMEFITRQAESPVIMITSAMPGDGKTFSAVNLASAYSLAGKKTLLVGFDMRRPTLSKCFNIEKIVGLSTYLIGKSTLEQIIFDTGYPNLHLIPSGPIPPNPGELSNSEKVREMFQKLKEQYDFIVVDTAPIGAVSDNYFTATIADATLIMVRHGQTNKKYLEITLTEAAAYGIHGLSLLVNDFKLGRGAYRYAYKYENSYSKDPS
ncbi:MAG: polysaccharide biosynthesis tyrosine autokinase [Bacteroidota bacterium]